MTDHRHTSDQATRPAGVGTMCGHDACGSTRAGHEVLAVQRRVAQAAPRAWRDAIVTATSPDGWVALALVEDDTVVTAWHHERLGLSAGEPVALHRSAGLLAVGAERVSVFVR